MAAERQAERAQLGELAGLKEEQRQRQKEIGEAAKQFMSLGLMAGSEAGTQAEQRKQMLGTATTFTPSKEAELRALYPDLSDEEIKKMLAIGGA